MTTILFQRSWPPQTRNVRKHQHDKQSRNSYMPSPCVPASFLYNSRFRTDVNTSTPRYVWDYGVVLAELITNLHAEFLPCSFPTFSAVLKEVMADLADLAKWWSRVTFEKPLTSLSLDHLFAKRQNIKVWAGKEMLCTIWACSMSVRHVLKRS